MFQSYKNLFPQIHIQNYNLRKTNFYLFIIAILQYIKIRTSLLGSRHMNTLQDLFKFYYAKRQP